MEVGFGKTVQDVCAGKYEELPQGAVRWVGPFWRGVWCVELPSQNRGSVVRMG